jgi:hypothetical protein
MKNACDTKPHLSIPSSPFPKRKYRVKQIDLNKRGFVTVIFLMLYIIICFFVYTLQIQSIMWECSSPKHFFVMVTSIVDIFAM